MITLGFLPGSASSEAAFLAFSLHPSAMTNRSTGKAKNCFLGVLNIRQGFSLLNYLKRFVLYNYLLYRGLKLQVSGLGICLESATCNTELRLPCYILFFASGYFSS